MKVLVVDDEMISLKVSCRNVKDALPDAEITSFNNPLAAEKDFQTNHYDMAFFDIEMPGLNGIELAKRFKIKQPKGKVLFYTAYSQYALDAFKVHASGYLLKGSSSEDIKKEIQALDDEDDTVVEKEKLVVKCFGKFDCFYHNQLVKFERSKSKELFAYLVVHGGKAMSLNDIESALFDGEEYSNSHLKQIHVFYASLAKSLKAINQEDVLVKSRDNYAVDVNKISCDYLDFQAGKVKAINEYDGDFLPDYEWAFL